MNTNPEELLEKGLSPIGAVSMFASDFSPENVIALAKLGWLPCNGDKLNTTKYADLFSVIRYSHGGAGDTFSLPDLRGTFVRGVDNGAKRDPDASSRFEPSPGGNKGDRVGSIQRDAFQRHSHDVPNLPYPESHWAVDEIHKYDVAKFNSGSRKTADEGQSSETRPKNVGLNFIIRYR